MRALCARPSPPARKKTWPRGIIIKKDEGRPGSELDGNRKDGGGREGGDLGGVRKHGVVVDDDDEVEGGDDDERSLFS